MTATTKIIQVKPGPDDDTDKKLSDVFKDILNRIKQRHELLNELAVMINIPVNNDGLQ